MKYLEILLRFIINVGIYIGVMIFLFGGVTILIKESALKNVEPGSFPFSLVYISVTFLWMAIGDKLTLKKPIK